MDKLDVSQHDKDLLRLGYPPEETAVLDAITVGESVWENFILEHYLAPGGFVSDGYSQMKIMVGRPGAGKTHLLRRLTSHAQALDHFAVFLSAPELRLQQIDSLYAAIATQVDMGELARRLAGRVVQELGYDLAQVPTGTSFLSWAVQEHHRIDTLVKRDVAEILGRLFKRERVDPNFSLAFTQLASGILGTVILADEDRSLIFRWLRGEKLLAEEIHRVYLARPIDRFNARDMLHALADFVRRQGYRGLFVAIDQMEDLPTGRDSKNNRLKYGGVALADTYQSLREMVDSLPSVPGLMIILAGQPAFLELPRGVKSYQALWLRIQHEVVSSWFNRFAQVVDLDRAIQVNLTQADVEGLHQRLASLALNTRPIHEVSIQEILAMAGGEGVYRRLMKAMLPDNSSRHALSGATGHENPLMVSLSNHEPPARPSTGSRHGESPPETG